MARTERGGRTAWIGSRRGELGSQMTQRRLLLVCVSSLLVGVGLGCAANRSVGGSVVAPSASRTEGAAAVEAEPGVREQPQLVVEQEPDPASTELGSATKLHPPGPGLRVALRPIPERSDVRDCAELPAAEPDTWAESVREVDWCNLDYGGFVDLQEGRQEVHIYPEMKGPHDTTIWRLVDLVFGDFDDDGVEDAVVLIESKHYSGQYSWREAEVYLYTVVDGELRAWGTATAPRVKEREWMMGGGVVELRFVREGERCVAQWGVVDGEFGVVVSACGEE